MAIFNQQPTVSGGPKNNTRKLILLAVVVVVCMLSAVLIMVGGGSKDRSSSSQKDTYTLETSILSYTLPVDFEPTSSDTESFTVGYNGSDKELLSSQIKIDRYLKKDSSNDNAEKLKSQLLKSGAGSELKTLTTDTSKTKDNKEVLTITDGENSKSSSVYIINSVYIWRIEAIANDSSSLKKLLPIATKVAESINEKN